MMAPLGRLVDARELSMEMVVPGALSRRSGSRILDGKLVRTCTMRQVVFVLSTLIFASLGCDSSAFRYV